MRNDSINLAEIQYEQMKQILLIGAGRSTHSLIHYLIKQAVDMEWKICIADLSIEAVKENFNAHDNIDFKVFNVKDEALRNELIQKADIVISMLPASMHIEVAKDCIKHGVDMVTASYISKEMKELESAAKEAGVCIVNEIGVDPGIDHLSAMKVIDRIKNEGGKITAFETFTGGLVAPESDNNPWNYKFTWNPRNVVVAGQGGAVKFIQEGTYKYIPYHKLFRRTEIIDIDGYGKFEGIANRDSLKYRSVYGLQDIQTMYRGTLRKPGFCRAWDAFVQLGATDDSYTLPDTEKMTFREFINLFLPYNPTDSVELKLRHYLNLAHDEIELFEKLAWLDIFKDIPVGIKDATPAQVLQKILERKWTLEADDKDMIVMWHKFLYEDADGKGHELHSSMVLKGEDQQNTAMALTVGLPVGITCKLILQKKIDEPGVHIPIKQEFYTLILDELESYGIVFKEKEIN